MGRSPCRLKRTIKHVIMWNSFSSEAFHLRKKGQVSADGEIKDERKAYERS